MIPIQKAALTAARVIRDRLAERHRDSAAIAMPDRPWTNARRLFGQIERAHQHGWDGAARQLTLDFGHEIACCRDRLTELEHRLHSRSTQSCLPAVGEVYREIMALYDEFADVEMDLDSHEIVVTTDRIVLEGIDLGPFAVRLNWDQLGRSHPYRVVALDPHPAAANDEVTHPHVQGEHLCEGEGRASIQAALAEGRLLDFFLVVHRLLQTYARGSAYVELTAWEGVACDDCGASTYEDNRYYCQRSPTSSTGRSIGA